MFGFTIGSFYHRDRGTRSRAHISLTHFCIPAYRQSCETLIISRVAVPFRLRSRLLIFKPVSDFAVI